MKFSNLRTKITHVPRPIKVRVINQLSYNIDSGTTFKDQIVEFEKKLILINLSDFGCTEAYWHLGLEGEGAWIEQQADGDAGGESKKCVVVEDTEVMQPLN